MKNLYITTAIPYVNGDPHVGHALDYLLADVYFRYHTLLGDKLRFQAGTDEHGNKVFEKALKSGLPVKAYADENSEKFRVFIDKLGVHPTDFIRTTDESHESRCKKIWEKLSPHIYSGSYEGWYCEGCENFVTEKEVSENSGICPDHKKPYICLSEKNYYLRISDFKDEIRQKIESDEMKILPEFRKKEILRLLDDTPDVSISRPKKNLSWGISVPGDDSQVMYVWIDALSNYITVLGYPDKDISADWPADVQFIGKDILRFHAIIWPAILLGLGLPLPKVLCSHGHVFVNGEKMSKSIGNVIDPVEALDRHGRDAFRYFFLRHLDTFSDSDFTWEKFDEAYSGELANDLGNLVQRLSVLAEKNDLVYNKKSPDFSPAYKDAMDVFDFNSAFNHAWAHIQAINKEISEVKPWELAKLGRLDECRAVLSNFIDTLLHATLELTPFLPDASEKIRSIFETKSGKISAPKTPLFPKN